MHAGPSQPIAISRAHQSSHDGGNNFQLDPDNDTEVLLYQSPRTAQSPSSVSIHPYPLFSASSFGRNGTGSFGSMSSYNAAGSIGSRFYPAASPGQIFNPLDPNELKCRIPSSVDSTHKPFFRAYSAEDLRREAELCQNYKCCGEPLNNMHNLVDHFEEEHVLMPVLDPRSGCYVHQAFTASAASAVQHADSQSRPHTLLRSSASSSSLAGALEFPSMKPNQSSDSISASAADHSVRQSHREYDTDMGIDLNMDMGPELDLDMDLDGASSSSSSSGSIASPVSLLNGPLLGNSPPDAQKDYSDMKPQAYVHRSNIWTTLQVQSHTSSPTPPDTPDIPTPSSAAFAHNESGFTWGTVNNRSDNMVNYQEDNQEDDSESHLSETYRPSAFDNTILHMQSNRGLHHNSHYLHPETKRPLHMTLSHPYSRTRFGGNQYIPSSDFGAGMNMPALNQQTMVDRNPINPYAVLVTEWSAGLPGAMGQDEEGNNQTSMSDGAFSSTPRGNYGLNTAMPSNVSYPLSAISDTQPTDLYQKPEPPMPNGNGNNGASLHGQERAFGEHRAITPSMLFAPLASGSNSGSLAPVPGASLPSQKKVGSRTGSPDHAGRPSPKFKFNSNTTSAPNTTPPSPLSANPTSVTTLSRPSSSLLLSKPFKCPKPGCTKSYKQANGLKYHVTHGSCSFTPPPELASLEGLSEVEAEKRLKPFCCQVPPCQRRYKNMNGLRYHYQHSGEHGAQGLALLAAGNHDATKSHPVVDTTVADAKASGPSSASSAPPTPITPDLPREPSGLQSMTHPSLQEPPYAPRFNFHAGMSSQALTQTQMQMPPPFNAAFATMQNQIMSQPPSAYATPWGSPKLGYTALPAEASGLSMGPPMSVDDWRHMQGQGDL